MCALWEIARVVIDYLKISRYLFHRNIDLFSNKQVDTDLLKDICIASFPVLILNCPYRQTFLYDFAIFLNKYTIIVKRLATLNYFALEIELKTPTEMLSF